MIIAVQGCCHGDLDSIYATLEYAQQQNGVKVDLLIICGDFEAIRNEYDVISLAVPDKFLKSGDFHSYYRGDKKAPCLTIFIGGNHECSNHLWGLYYGGWVAPNIYYMGNSGCIRFGKTYDTSIRIAGLSGIYNHRHYSMVYNEEPPYTNDTKRTIYHVRKYEVEKLRALSRPVHVVVSHDWPRGIWEFGDKKFLLQKKPDFEEDFQKGTFGNPATMPLLQLLRPTYWFAAHHHIKFSAIVPHQDDAEVEGGEEMEQRTKIRRQNPHSTVPNTTQRTDVPAQSPFAHAFPANHPTEYPPGQAQGQLQTPKSVTRFLALDKCLPNRKYMQILDLSVDFNDTATSSTTTTPTSTAPTTGGALPTHFGTPERTSFATTCGVEPNTPAMDDFLGSLGKFLQALGVVMDFGVVLSTNVATSIQDQAKVAQATEATGAHAGFFKDQVLPRLLEHFSGATKQAEAASSTTTGGSANNANGSYKLFYDTEWLSILTVAHEYFPTSKRQNVPSTYAMATKLSDREHLIAVEKSIAESGKFGSFPADTTGLEIPHNFQQTVAPLDLSVKHNYFQLQKTAPPPAAQSTDNPQTREFLTKLGILENWIANSTPKEESKPKANTVGKGWWGAAMKPKKGLQLPPPKTQQPEPTAPVTEELEVFVDTTGSG